VHAPNCFSTKEDEIEKIKDEIKRKRKEMKMRKKKRKERHSLLFCACTQLF
jgi:hypothetical protein